MQDSTTGREDNSREKAEQKAFRLLSIRGRSIKELRSRLKEKGFEEPVAEEVIARLIELKYLDDESFASQWAQNLAVNRLYGNRRIEVSLSWGLPGHSICKSVVGLGS